MEDLGAILEGLGGILEALGRLLAGSWKPSWRILGPSWPVLEAKLALLRATWTPLRANLGGFWDTLAVLEATQSDFCSPRLITDLAKISTRRLLGEHHTNARLAPGQHQESAAARRHSSTSDISYVADFSCPYRRFRRLVIKCCGPLRNNLSDACLRLRSVMPEEPRTFRRRTAFHGFLWARWMSGASNKGLPDTLARRSS